MAATTQSAGAERAAKRLADKLTANGRLYANLPAKPDSRQVRRRPVPIYSWDSAGTRTIRAFA